MLPDLSRSRHLALFHRAIDGQWSPDEVSWDAPARLTEPKLRRALARTLTPVLTGEQAAFYSLSTIIPILGREMQVESQMFLTSMALDEARHVELFARACLRLDEQPLTIRRFPSGYLFQSVILSEDPGEWMVGSLISEVLAQRVLQEFRDLDLDPVLSEICHRVLVDEARHLAFNHAFLEDRFGSVLGGDVARDAEEARLRARCELVLERVPPMFEALAAELRELGMRAEEVQHDVFRNSRRRLDASLAAARKRGAAAPPATQGA